MSLFMDGVSDLISYHLIRGLFSCLVKVFVRCFWRLGRRFCFAFVCFSSLKAVSTTIKRLDEFMMGKVILFVSLSKPPNKVVMDFGTNGSAHHSASRNSISGLGGPSWRDNFLGVKKDSHVSFSPVAEVVVAHTFDRGVVPVTWLKFFARWG